ncbi:MAG: aldo/keto reductase [Acidobacteria bacterium]|jgi:aryl-alcohol dehydrogenase-like predicted oxidoreductase|nr:aldo/keto reductase [Acidobacteriota bacterium]MDP7337970.1 aldo/keto reductase [Vicinamibacterales bacterium]MDP7479445.1 aldo/keto reductase [Vicinamibacterales bacterium]MDP7690254.1 aldo/keto reductase [Vicinamibacterales bacterium]HJN43336.1 aldo/keto reductase [Vicinamibacterales bacterium]|tara:strand:+ start:583 stop:1626 length:1044 start_codon:yes stop_codon:yes gene_type:complete
MNHRRLANTGIYVSELCLGAMTFGGIGPFQAIGALGQTEADTLVHRSLDAGINFFDTANVYSAGQSEEMLGKALGARRPDVIVATKVRGRMGEGPNQIGLSRVHIMQECDASLRRLGTDYIDLYQIHGHDPVTDIGETLGALNDLVRAGKVRYVGCSNLTAWQLMKALGISRQQGLAEFISTQSYYSIAGRELEREMIPLVEDQGLAVLPWSPLAGGFLSGKFTRDSETDPNARRVKFDFPPVDKERGYDIIDVMREVATAHEVSVAQVALAWLLHQTAVTSVIIGAKRLDQLDDNLGSVDLTLTDAELERLNTVSALSPEYPGWMRILQADRAPGTTRNWDQYVKK